MYSPYFSTCQNQEIRKVFRKVEDVCRFIYGSISGSGIGAFPILGRTLPDLRNILFQGIIETPVVGTSATFFGQGQAWRST